MADIKKPVTGGATVIVASKMPFDFKLRLYNFKKRYEPIVGGGQREYEIAELRHGSPELVVKGNSFAQNTGPQFEMSSGMALTGGIPKEFWEEWLLQNKEADYVVNGMIFASEQRESVVSQARDVDSVKSGLERLDRQNLPKNVQDNNIRRAS